MESKKINQLATELTPVLSDLTIIGDPTTGISKKITLSQMASLFTGTVEEYPNLASFPLVGTADTIYIALDTNVLYRWNTGTNAYVELSPNIINSLVFNDANGFDGTISLVGSVATLTITTALTTGSVGFIGASGALLQDNANFFWDDSNNRLGLGTNAPTTAIDVFGSGIIGRLNGTSTNNAFLGFASAGSNKWSIGNVQSDHRFRIYSETNTSELLTVLQTGEFGIGIANPTTKFHIDGGASALIANLDANVSVAKSLSFRSDNSNRFNIEVSGTESGSNAGANFFIRRYSDAGALIDTPLTITRSTGVATFATSIVIGSGASNQSLNIFGTSGVGLEINETTTGTSKRLSLTQTSTSVIYNATFGSGTNEHIFQVGNTTILTIDGTNSTFTNNVISASLRTKGDLLLEASNSINRWSLYTFTDNSFRMNYNGVGNDEFIMTSSGAATFSSSVRANAASTIYGATQDAIQTIFTLGGQNASAQAKELYFRLTAGGTPQWTLQTASVGTDSDINIYPSGANGLKIAYSGAATFSSSVAVGTILSIGSNAGAGSVFQYNFSGANANSRTWRTSIDNVTYGDWVLQQATTQGGSTFANILRFSETAAASFSNTISATSATFAGNITMPNGTNREIYMGSVSNYNYKLRTDGDDFVITEAASTDRLRYSYSNTRWFITGGLTISGSIAKGSGSFKIDHPLESMSETHHLVHSFVESPQANNIYRGKIQLKNGIAEVNLDEVSTMTEGTFVALNREIHTYTSNETDWDAVKGKVEENILYIECQNNKSTAIVSWLVIGERKDKHIMDTDWTDENGKVIVEPLKPIKEEEIIEEEIKEEEIIENINK
jgi:hypothetical protein